MGLEARHPIPAYPVMEYAGGSSGSPATAEEQALEELPQPLPVTDLNIYPPNLFDQGQILMSRYLTSISSGIDSFFVDVFFADDVLDDEVPGSRLLLGIQTKRVFGEGVVYEPVLNLKLDLPHTNKRLKLLLESELDETEQSSDLLTTTESVQYSTALRIILGETKRWKFTWDNGIRIDLPLNPFSRVRARRKFNLGEWEGRFTQEIFWFNHDGFGERSRLSLARPMDIDLLLRWDANYTYLLDNNYFTLSHVLGLYQELSEKDAVAYQIGLSGNTIGSDQVQEYFSRIRYRRNLYKKWMFFELAPDIRYIKSNAFRPSPGLLARFEILFGGKRK